MSQMHMCKDGTMDVTGRNTPKDNIICENRGGVNEEAKPNLNPAVEYDGQPFPPGRTSTQVAGYMGIPQIGWIAIIGVGVYYAYSKGMFKKL